MKGGIFPFTVVGIYGALIAYGLHYTGSPYVLIALVGYAFILASFKDEEGKK